MNLHGKSAPGDVENRSIVELCLKVSKQFFRKGPEVTGGLWGRKLRKDTPPLHKKQTTRIQRTYVANFSAFIVAEEIKIFSSGRSLAKSLMSDSRMSV